MKKIKKLFKKVVNSLLLALGFVSTILFFIFLVIITRAFEFLWKSVCIIIVILIFIWMLF